MPTSLLDSQRNIFDHDGPEAARDERYAGANVFGSVAPKEKSTKEKYDALRRRDTNFIFLFGSPGTGKSCITASLIYFMKVCNLGDLIVAPSNSGDAHHTVQDMYESIQRGEFLPRTNTQVFATEIDLIFRPKNRKSDKDDMRITFLEISGEHLTKVRINRNMANSGSLPEDIETYFNCPDLNLIFFLVADHVSASRDAQTINSFLDYVFNKDEGFDLAHYLLAITKWDTYDGVYRNDVEEFAEHTIPDVYNRLIKHHGNNALTNYSIGKIHKRVAGDMAVDEIVDLDLTKAEAVTCWLYKRITGKSLVPEPAPLQKALAKAKQFLGI